MTPATYRKGAPGVEIDFTIAESPLGRLLLAATARGVCRVMIGDNDTELERDLRQEYPHADRSAQRSHPQRAGAHAARALARPIAPRRSAARRQGHSLSMARLAAAAGDSLRRDAHVSRGCGGDRQAVGDASGRPRVCHQPSRAPHSLSSRHSHRRLDGRLPLGNTAQRGASRTGARAPARDRCVRCDRSRYDDGTMDDPASTRMFPPCPKPATGPPTGSIRFPHPGVRPIRGTAATSRPTSRLSAAARSAAPTAYVFAAAGIDVALFEQGRVAQRQAARSTGVVVHEPEPDFYKLAKQHGVRDARHIYQTARRGSLEYLAALRRLRIDCGLQVRDALHFSSTAGRH